MGWRLKVINEWKNAGVIERASWIVELGFLIMTAVAWFYGVTRSESIFILLSLVFFIISLIVIALNISMRHERDDAISNKEKLECTNKNLATELDGIQKILEKETKHHNVAIAQWKKDCQWLWDRNETLQKLVDEFAPPSKPKVLTLDASMLLEPTTPEEAKRGEIYNRLKN